MATNYTALLWLFEVKAGEPAALLYGFATPSERALTKAWSSFKLPDKFARLPLREGVEPILYRLTRVMSRTEVDRFFESLGLGSIDLTVSVSRRQPFSIRGQWFLRQATEAPLAALNSYDIKLTNLSGSGAAVRRTAWRLHWDVLGEYCLTFSDKTELAEIQASDGYRELLVALGKDVGLHFLGDDFPQLGNFDIYNGRIDESPEVHGLIGDVITQGDPPEVIGFDVRVPEALLRKLGPLIVKVELHSRFDRTFCKIFRLAADANGLIPVLLGDLELFCSGRIEVFREDTGELVTQEAGDLIRSLDASATITSELRTIDTPWSQKQKRTRPGQQATSSLLITLNATRQISMPTLRRDFPKDPWNFLANKLAQSRSILAESHEDALLSEITDPNETNRTTPLVSLLNTAAYTKAEIFDPYFDTQGVDKLVLRMSAQDLDLHVFTNPDQTKERTRIIDLKKALEVRGSSIPCALRVTVLQRSFHDRFLFLHTPDGISAYVLTNSLDGLNKDCPLWIVPMKGRAGVLAHQYAQSLREPHPQKLNQILWDSVEYSQKVRRTMDEKRHLEYLDLLSTEAYRWLESNGFILDNDRVPESVSPDAVRDLLSRPTTPDFGVLGRLCYHDIVQELDVQDALVQRFAITPVEINTLVKALEETFRPPDLAQGPTVCGIATRLKKMIETRSTGTFSLSGAFSYLAGWMTGERLYGMANPYRSYLWGWLADAAPERAYELCLKLHDLAWLNYVIETFHGNPKRLQWIVALAQQRQDDQFLLSLALVIVTQSAVGVPASRSLGPDACLSTWDQCFPGRIIGRLKTFALLVAYGHRCAEDLGVLQQRVIEAWKAAPPSLDELQDINYLVRDGVVNMRHARVFELSESLRNAGIVEWAGRIEGILLESMEQHFKADAEQFHFFRPEDGPLFSCACKILRSYPLELRQKWLEKMSPRSDPYLPNHPFLMTRNCERFWGSVNQVGLWLLLRFWSDEDANAHGRVLQDFREMLLPGAFAHTDDRGILRSLAEVLQGFVQIAGNLDWTALWAEVDAQAHDRLCSWWMQP